MLGSLSTTPNPRHDVTARHTGWGPQAPRQAVWKYQQVQTKHAPPKKACLQPKAQARGSPVRQKTFTQQPVQHRHPLLLWLLVKTPVNLGVVNWRDTRPGLPHDLGTGIRHLVQLFHRLQNGNCFIAFWEGTPPSNKPQAASADTVLQSPRSRPRHCGFLSHNPGPSWGGRRGCAVKRRD